MKRFIQLVLFPILLMIAVCDEDENIIQTIDVGIDVYKVTTSSPTDTGKYSDFNSSYTTITNYGVLIWRK